MVDVEVLVKPIIGSQHVALSGDSILFVDNDFQPHAQTRAGVIVNGTQMVCADPEWEAFIKKMPKEGDEFVRSAPLVELNLDGFMTLTLRHLTDDSYAFIESLGPDVWAWGSTREEMTLLVRSFVVNVVEPAMA